MEVPVPPISKREREIAIRVLMRSRIVRKWVESEAAFLEIKKDTPRYDEFYRKQARIYAEKLVK